jgi:transcriptional regulator with PAS, ATPase and Fis domain
MKKILVCWIGNTDLEAPEKNTRIGLGPIAQAATTESYGEIVLLSDYSKDRVSNYITWLKSKTNNRISVYFKPLSGPTQFGEIYEAAVQVVSEVLKQHGKNINLIFHLSPGTPAMAAVWIILSKTRFPAALIESSKEHGVRTASVPFDISAEYIPDLLRHSDSQITRLAGGLPMDAPEFADIIFRSEVMQRVILKSQQIAPRSIPVLIEGESGTGKEMFARAIHRASPRMDKPFNAINCGAIPSELIESELFGHEKGAFTGAIKGHKGYFEETNSGTLFLDEIGELPKQAQVKMLRVLQEGEIVRIGAVKPNKVDVRIIAATNRTLIEEISRGNFREDLFYRLAVAVIKLPPLKERVGDIGYLIDKLLSKINQDYAAESVKDHKIISANARNLLIQYPWPGNVRELINTLTRAVLWSKSNTIEESDIREALLPNPLKINNKDAILNRPLDNGINLPALMKEVAVHYIERGMVKTNKNKTKAAELLGLSNYQTLTNWLKKYGME